MKKYFVHRVEQKPRWSEIPVLVIDHPYHKEEQNILAFAQICYNTDALMVHMWAEEKNLRIVEAGPLGMPSEDSCLEFFFCPIEDDKRYFNFEFNPNGCMYLGMGSSLAGLTRLVPDEIDKLFEPLIRRTEMGWELFFKVPYQFVQRFFPGFSVEAGKSIFANCYKCAELAEPPHYFSWNPVVIEPLTFHCPECFGMMTFAE